MLLLLLSKTLYILWRSFIIHKKTSESCRLVLLLFIVVNVVSDDDVVVVVVAYVEDIMYIMEKFYNT